MSKPSRTTFLKARWTNLVLLTFPTSKEVLSPYLPPGLELDCFEGRPFLSLVAFQFLDAQFFGIRPPLFHSFSELNLRFYVKVPGQAERGVVFIREICPYHLVAWTARLFFNEKFLVGSCSFDRHDSEYQYSFQIENIRTEESQILSVMPVSDLYLPESKSLSHYIIERYYGYSAWYGSRTLRYDVLHEPWSIQDARMTRCTLDFEKLYGPKLAQDLRKSPLSTLSSPGSAIDLSIGTQLRNRS